VSLALYRTKPLDSLLLDRLAAGFRTARTEGVKLILRFKYSSSLSEPDAPKAWILHHVEQLRPVLEANADVIAVLQAGFIGAWGEWHHSSNGLDNPQDRSDVLQAVLRALPPYRMVQIRTPFLKAQVLGDAALEEAEAFTGTPRARVGHHNDAFLASADDFGTYPLPVEPWMDRVAQEGRFVPVGGETAALNPPRTDGAPAIREMERLRWSFLNLSYHPDVISGWRDDGSLDEIRRRLGYRFSLIDASWPRAVPPGGRLDVALRLKNRGFAAPFNERPVFLVLARESTRIAAQVRTADPRRWGPGEELSLKSSFQLPAGLAPGRYRLALWLPDPAPALRARAEYAIRLANEEVWDPSSGLNVLTEALTVDAAAPGPSDPGASEFYPVR
jgi:hypothetical protein